MSRNTKIFLLAIVVVLIGVAIYSSGQQTVSDPLVPAIDTSPPEVTNVDASALMEESCSDAGGEWEECGSVCRGADEGTVCIEMCVEHCECHGDDQCPASHSCQDFVEEVGICKPF